jgi:hypothetical protein
MDRVSALLGHSSIKVTEKHRTLRGYVLASSSQRRTSGAVGNNPYRSVCQDQSCEARDDIWYTLSRGYRPAARFCCRWRKAASTALRSREAQFIVACKGPRLRVR